MTASGLHRQNNMPREKRSASTSMALAAIHEPTMRTPMRCQPRVRQLVAMTTIASARPAASPVPSSAAVASASEIACGGESRPSARPADQRDRPPTTVCGSATPSANQRAADGAGQQENVERRRQPDAASAIAARPTASPATNAQRGQQSAARLTADQQSQCPASASRCAGIVSGLRRPPANAAKLMPCRSGRRDPASAIAPPAARTAKRPAGQRARSPNAMPARCSRPVAMTKPTE